MLIYYLLGTINVCHAFIPLIYGRQIKLKNKYANGGRIINISSMLSDFPIDKLTAYCSSKSGISHFSIMYYVLN